MRVKYVGPFEEVELYDTGEWVANGDTVDVSAELAGKAPSGEPGTDGYDPGEGLLAQTSNWVAADAEEHTHKAKRKAPVRDSGGITDGGEDQ